MAAIQHQANKPTPKKTKSSATPRHPISSLGRSRKSAASLNVSRENAFNPPMSSHGRSGGARIRPQHRNLISNKNHNYNSNLRPVREEVAGAGRTTRTNGAPSNAPAAP